jgi:hypothetical protein
MKRLIFALAITALAATATAKETVPFLENDYTAALSKARAKNVPIFVEAWAPW